VTAVPSGATESTGWVAECACESVWVAPRVPSAAIGVARTRRTGRWRRTVSTTALPSASSPEYQTFSNGSGALSGRSGPKPAPERLGCRRPAAPSVTKVWPGLSL
jgi:hypothetical protein